MWKSYKLEANKSLPWPHAGGYFNEESHLNNKPRDPGPDKRPAAHIAGYRFNQPTWWWVWEEGDPEDGEYGP